MVGGRRMAATHQTVKDRGMSCPDKVAEVVETGCPPGSSWSQV